MASVGPNRALIQDDLRGLLSGEVRCDPVHLQLYASDASVYEICPLAVVRPRNTADVAALVQYAAEKNLPLHARGAGSGVAGESLGHGIVVDFSRFLRRVVAVDAETVRVQPGVTLERLNAHLRARGRVFGPDPANAAVTTLGGMISVNAVGSRWMKYGAVRDHVRSLQVVLANGHVVELGREAVTAEEATLSTAATFAASGSAAGNGAAVKSEVVRRVAALIAQQGDLIRAGLPNTLVHRCGYVLHDVLRDGTLDLARLFVGSEGTLGLITEATIATQPLHRARAAAMLMFDSLERASRAALDIVREGPTACDLVDRRHVALAREVDSRFASMISAETEALLLVEQQGDEPYKVRQWMQRMTEELLREKRLCLAARQAFDAEEIDFFWQLVTRFRPALYRLRGPARPVPVVEDLVVPPELLPEFLVRVQNALKRQQVTASLSCHVGQGQLQLQPLLDLASAEDIARMQRLADDLYEEVFAVGGTIGGENACGLSRTPYVRRQAGPLYDVFRELKAIFDPAGILNPGKIVGDDLESLVHNVRPALNNAAPPAAAATAASASPPAASAAPPPAANEGQPRQGGKPLRNLVELQLNWNPAPVVEAAASCNRCGDCRVQSAPQRMCPIFRASPSEEASPRAKANLLRGILTGTIELSRLASDELKQVADLCVHCHCCRLECPARVDVPQMMREVKGAHVRANGLQLHQWLTTHLDTVGGWANLMSSAVNWAFGNRACRWLMEKSLGIAQGRKLPRVAARSFLRLAHRRKWTRLSRRGGRKVAYFVDLYANHFDPELGEAFVAVLKRNGIVVHVPPEQLQAGMPSIACGSLDHARRLARRNIAVLAEAVRQGCHIVATEPSAALCLVREYPQLFEGDDDAQLVAAHTSEACTYLWNLNAQGDLRLDFRPLFATVGYHLPCHLRALDVGSPGESLLGLIPGLRVVRVEEGCSGMAGTFGLMQKNYRTSLRAGWPLISRLRDTRLQLGASECSACKLQMEQGTTKPTVHPIKLLAMAYGVMPELDRSLHVSRDDLTTT